MRDKLTAKWRWWSAAFIACFAGALLAGLDAPPLQDPDEGRYADIAASMTGGDWITPRLNGIPYYEKPPLFFWLAAAAMRALGRGEAAARLPSAAAALVTLVVIGRWGRRTFGGATGLLSAVTLATVPLFFVLARVALVDGLLTCATTLALHAAHRGFVEPAPHEPPRSGWQLGFWASAAVACMVKGPVGLVLPLGALVGYLVASGSLGRLARLAEPAGPALFAALTLPWYGVMAVRNPGYVRAFLVEENFGRLVDGELYNRRGPFWYYVPLVVVLFLPWSLALPSAARRAWRALGRPASSRARARVFLACAVVVPFGVLSLAQSKLSYYLLPLAPPLALWLADAAAPLLCRERAATPWHRRRIPVMVLLLAAGSIALLALVAVGAERAGRSWPLALARVVRPALTAGHLAALDAAALSLTLGLSAFAAGAFFAAGLILRRRTWAAVASYAAGCLVFSAILPWVAVQSGAFDEARRMATVIDDHVLDGENVLLYGPYLRGISFYLGRPVLLWNASHAEFGHVVSEATSPNALQRDLVALDERLRRESSLLILSGDPGGLEQLGSLLPSELEVLHREGRYTLARARPRDPPQDPRSLAGAPGAGPG